MFFFTTSNPELLLLFAHCLLIVHAHTLISLTVLAYRGITSRHAQPSESHIPHTPWLESR